ncbi:MAG: 1-deoxy-D-xylulose-5-phosphate reductoisomerase [candidate division KSB1 bacterium]|nr:1-deoxy-D-xylulose-5-phosphate reductoisomerase [candidate division KSB1 bacterium]
MSKTIAVLGATGSIGCNVLHCVDQFPEQFRVQALTTHTHVDKLLELVKRYKPEFAAVTGRSPADHDINLFQDLGVTVFTGQDALTRIAAKADYDLFVNSVVGAAGFLPTLAALDRGKEIALANKETLVIGGELVMKKAHEKGITILPIDSEHSAVFQSLMGEEHQAVEEIILTASGGPFRTWDRERFSQVTVEQALNHPNWSMGNKITIDSATMMNKGLEVIEAHWLFDVPVEKVRVVIHPQSIIHSMVAFRDGSVKGQMGVPDMRVPIQLALTWPERWSSDFPRLDFDTLRELTFTPPDFQKFQCLALAYDAANRRGTAPAVMNAANEAAVQLFLSNVIRFDQIPELIDRALQDFNHVSKPDEAELIRADQWAREFVLAKKS